MEETTTPLRERMIEDMRVRGLGEKAQKAHIRASRISPGFSGAIPGHATADDLRAYQLHMSDTGIMPTCSTLASSRFASSSG